MEPNTIVETKDAEFFEHIFPMRTFLERPSRPQVVEPNLKPDDIQELRRSKRIRKETNLGDDFYTFLVDNDPQTYSEAISSPDAIFWKEAINNEIESIMSNHTWELVSLPPGAKTIGCKWIFKKKLKPDGSIEKFKARLVAKGYSQKKDIDYFDTFAPVTRITSIRVLIALASIHKLIIHQMDVKTAFFNRDLEEEIYMDQPEGCVFPGNEHKVCKLIKSLYGLKQAPKQWHDKFDKMLVSNGYQINSADKCIYSKVVNHECVIICLYMDDMLIFGTNFDIVTSTHANWMGYIAVATDPLEIARLGRRDIVVAWRGTVTYLEWIHDLKDILTPAHFGDDPSVKVESGFLDLYTMKEHQCNYCSFSAREQVLADVKRLVERFKGEELSITVTGHSLGAALALLSAYDVAEMRLNVKEDGETIPVTVISLAGPRVGNLRFKQRCEELGVKVLRVINVHDRVPSVPGIIANEKFQYQRLVEEVMSFPWSYAHVGVELALDHSESPFLKEKADVTCAHNLEAHLHLVDGYHGKGRGFG